MYKRILLATDGSEASALALAHAIRLAKDQGATLRIASVVESTRMMLSLAGGYPVDLGPLVDSLREAATKMIDEAVAAARTDGVATETVLLDDQDAPQGVAGVLGKEALDSQADLMVLGTHGRSGVRHLLLGSIAESLVRLAPVPVLLVRAKAVAT
ncbi:MAG: universal stress protein [Burkholderiales bacterium]